VIGVITHPIYENIVLALTEGGSISVLDTTGGTVVYENVAQVKLNSSWAFDPESMAVLIVGDNGRGSLFDFSLGYDRQT
jgi:hypothetical protein